MIEQNVLSAIIAGVSTLAGVVVSSLLAYFISSRSDRQKARHASAEFLQKKLFKLEEEKGGLIASAASRRSLENEVPMSELNFAVALESDYVRCDETLCRIGHYLPADTRVKLLAASDNLRKDIWEAHSNRRDGIASGPEPSQTAINEMLEFAGNVRRSLDDELVRTKERICNIYALAD